MHKQSILTFAFSSMATKPIAQNTSNLNCQSFQDTTEFESLNSFVYG